MCARRGLVRSLVAQAGNATEGFAGGALANDYGMDPGSVHSSKDLVALASGSRRPADSVSEERLLPVYKGGQLLDRVAKICGGLIPLLWVDIQGSVDDGAHLSRDEGPVMRAVRKGAGKNLC